MNQPKVSVIIPVYNVEKLLPQCLDSVLNQTLKEIEVICVNDGSPDNSQSILEAYARSDSRITILKKENGGLSSARNYGMQRAKGEYIGFVDSDDFVERDMFQKLYERGVETESDIVVGNLCLYDHKTKEISEYRDLQLYLFLKNKVFRAEDYPEFIRNIAAWDRIYRRSFLESSKVLFPEGRVYEDAPFTMQTVMLADRISVIPDILYYYRKNEGNSITDREAKNERYKKDFLEVNRQIRDFFATIPISDEIRKEYLTYFMLNAIVHQKNAVAYTYASEFFSRMREMLTEQDYTIIQTIEYMPIRFYCNFLKKNKYHRAYFYFWLRNHFRRENGHIYMRLDKRGKEFRLH